MCENPVRIYKNLAVSEYPDGLVVPCGKCLPCRVKKRAEWSARVLHELSNWKENMFVTLTYDEDNIPDNRSLRKRDFQLFMKRLRKSLEDRSIRYFACGEYGMQTQRPHYHAIIFGIGLSAQDVEMVEMAWKKGFCSFGLAERDSVRYVAQYIDKKFSGELELKEYLEKGREPVFKLSSLGIGKVWCDENGEQLRVNKFTSVKGIRMSLPRYYVKRLGIEAEDFRDYAEDKERSLVESYTGVYNLKDELYRASKEDYIVYVKRRQEAIGQNSKNLSAKIALRKTKI